VDGAIAAAAQAVDDELAQADVDEQFALVLRACAVGGCHSLQTLCDVVAGPSRPVDELPVLALLEAVGDEAGARRAVRAAVWVMLTQRITETWPGSWYDTLLVARAALPLPTIEWERMRPLALHTANALRTEDASEREGLHLQFHREALEIIIEAATYKRPVRQQMLHVLSYWTTCFAAGIRACDEHLHALDPPTG
jgi:hypothetical protein